MTNFAGNWSVCWHFPESHLPKNEQKNSLTITIPAGGAIQRNADISSLVSCHEIESCAGPWKKACSLCFLHEESPLSTHSTSSHGRVLLLPNHAAHLGECCFIRVACTCFEVEDQYLAPGQ